MNLSVQDLILNATHKGQQFTTQSITESIYQCKKGDRIYKLQVDEVGRELQKLAKKGKLSKERIDTGKGYYIVNWERIE